MTIQRTAQEWMADLYVDTNPQTGSIVQSPKGVYGRHVQELVHYFSNQSVELKAIRHSRLTKPNVMILYIGYVFQFLSEYIFPVGLALYVSHTYYYSVPYSNWNLNLNSNSVESNVPAAATEDVSDTSWFHWAPSPTDAGKWLGSTLRGIASTPVTFLAHTFDRGLHVQEAMNTLHTTGSKFVFTPLLFVAVYITTKLLCRCIIHIQSLCASQRRVWNLQEIIIQETEEALERAITDILRPFLLENYEEMVAPPSSISEIVSTHHGALALAQTYKENLPLMRMNLINRISTVIKRMPFAELVKRGGLSPMYNDTLRQLVRYADEELSNTIFTFHEEIHKIPEAIHSRVIDVGTRAIQTTKRIVGNTARVAATAL